MQQSKAAIRVVLGEGPELIRAGLKSLLKQSGISVIGEASDWDELVKVVEKVCPDVLVFDFDLCPGTGGRFDRLERCVKQLNAVKIVVVGPLGLVDLKARLCRVGVYGYLSKTAASPSVFASCVRRVAAGGVYIAATDVGLVEGVGNMSLISERDLARLSPRQVDVLKEIAEGLTCKQIGLKLGISVKTVESHRSSLMQRLEIFDVASLVKFAIKVGLIDLD